MDDRCEVEPGAKRGTVKFVGRAEALGCGFWVGVQYDEPLGKHDGMYVHSQIIAVINSSPCVKSVTGHYELACQILIYDIFHDD